MSLLRIQELKNTIKAKGLVKGIDDAGVHIEDPKTKEIAVLNLDVFQAFVGKDINLSVIESAKSEEEITDEDEDEE
jgi:hypothetical protein